MANFSIGDGAKIEGTSTPLEVYNNLYYLTLESVSLNEKRLEIDPEIFKRTESGSGGTVIDPGTTVSFLATGAYNVLRDEVQKLFDGRLEKVEELSVPSVSPEGNDLNVVGIMAQQHYNVAYDLAASQEDIVAMLENEMHKSSKDWKYSYDNPRPQAEAWGDKDANLMDFAPSLSDEVFTMNMLEEYNKEALKGQVFKQEMMAFLENNNAIIFTDEDIQVVFPNHRRPFEETIGYIKIDLKIGPIRSFTKFYVMDINHKLAVSTYHQCVKGRIGLRPIRIPRNQMSFNLNEVHYFDVEF
ncbi:aspartic proteinase CDR1-like [Pyrus ussuriensis x Pyrus communis]|uniref:Aspartic proteinase CDR1-like n=1 Tax=Pyrus ussuriensis x Pyrus communis TaxID=2448454 RepID=A0A5N5HG53_9ROSA|nr:aspartic proteinase CDR1-like [Pyrus ussuriensis x Pyrus communis]